MNADEFNSSQSTAGYSYPYADDHTIWPGAQPDGNLEGLSGMSINVPPSQFRPPPQDGRRGRDPDGVDPDTVFDGTSRLGRSSSGGTRRSKGSGVSGSGGAPSVGSEFSADGDVDGKAEFAEIMKNSLAGAMREVFGKKETVPTTAPVTTLSGLTITEGAGRSNEEILRGRTQLSRHERGTGATKEKVRKGLCVALKYDFAVTDYAKILSGTDDDVAAKTMQVQEVVKEFSKFATKIDARSIYLIPVGVDDFSDVRKVLGASTHTDLLKDYHQVTLDLCKKHQAFINTSANPVEMESSNWCLDVLTQSTEKTLLQRVQQKHDKLPESEQGGVTFFKMLVDEVDSCTFEIRQSGIEWVKTFDIRNFDGQDVSQACTTFKAMIDALGTHANPGYTRILLQGLSNADCKDFHDTCVSQIGMLSNHIYRKMVRDDGGSERSELDEFCSTVVERYNSLVQVGEWGKAASHKATTFKATLLGKQETALTTSTTQSGAKPKLSFEEWWKSSKCSVENCGGSHPTKYHNDLGALNRRTKRAGSNNRKEDTRGGFKRTQDRRSSRTREANRRDPPKFKSNEARTRFRQQVHQAALEAFDEDDHELFAHLAGGDDDDGEYESAVESLKGDEDAEEEEAMAHAAISMDALLNW